jgi:transaldolase
MLRRSYTKSARASGSITSPAALLTSGTLRRYIQDLSVTGLTSNPTIFDHAIKNSLDYDDAISQKQKEGKSSEALFFELAIEDLRQAADLFRPIYDRTNGVDGWVSLEVSPLLARDTAGTLSAAKALHARAGRPNLFIKIPGTSEGLPAIEEAIFAGVPINVTLLFSGAQYVAAAEAYLRGIERRIAAGLNPDVGSVASLFVSRWDVAVAHKEPESLRNQLGIAIAGETYERYRALLDSPRSQRILNAGARPQRLLWASTGTKDPKASNILYVEALALPFTINTMPEATLKALAAHEEFGEVSTQGYRQDSRGIRRRLVLIHGRCRRPVARRRGRLLRQVLGRSAVLHRVQERDARRRMSLEGEDGGRKPQFRTYILPWKKRLSLLHVDVIKEDGLRMRGVGGKNAE